MKLHSKLIPMVGHQAPNGLPMFEPAEFEPPEDAVNVTSTCLVVNNQACLAVSWVELTRQERFALMAQQQQHQGRVTL